MLDISFILCNDYFYTKFATFLPKKKGKKRSQKYHFGLTSTSLSVNSLNSYHSPPSLPTGIGERMKISTGLGTLTAKTNTPGGGGGADGFSAKLDVFSNWILTGSTRIHPSPDIATSQTGLQMQF